MPDRSERSSKAPVKSMRKSKKVVAPVEVDTETLAAHRSNVEALLQAMEETMDETTYDEEDHSSPLASTSTLPTSDNASRSPHPLLSPTPSPKPQKRKPTNLERAEPTDEEWTAFLATFENLPYTTKKEDYTLEMMREIERRYWRTLTFGESPMYGADMAGQSSRSTGA